MLEIALMGSDFRFLSTCAFPAADFVISATAQTNSSATTNHDDWNSNIKNQGNYVDCFNCPVHYVESCSYSFAKRFSFSSSSTCYDSAVLIGC